MVALFAYQSLQFLFVSLVPASCRYPLARFLARAAYLFNARQRRILIRNLEPVVGAERARQVAPELLSQWAMTEVDFFCGRKQNIVIETENAAVVDRTYCESKKVILTTAHIGHWELGIRYLVNQGYPVTALYAPYREDRFVRWLMRFRPAKAQWIAAGEGAAEACVKALERGRLLGVVADLPFGSRGRRLPLCNGQASLPLGPWAIAIRAGATVIPSFIIRQTPGRYRIVFHEPIVPGAGSFRQQMTVMQDRFRDLLETTLRQYPHQWGVLGPFWTA